MFAYARKSEPAAPDYVTLFDYDEARLLAGSGSALLDAYIHPSNVNPYEAGPHTPLARIVAASAEVRGDVFARACALGLERNPDIEAGDLYIAARLGRALPYLRGLIGTLHDTDMVLPSAAAAVLIRQDKAIVASGWFDGPPQGVSRAIGDEARTLAAMAIRAAEPRRDPGFDAVLEAYLAAFESRCAAYDARELTAALAFARTCLEALGRDPEAFGPIRALAPGLCAADRLLETWRNELPPLLWRFFASYWNFNIGDDSGERVALIEQMVAQGPDGRGALAERLWRMMEEAQLTPEDVPFRFETLLSLRGKNFTRPWARVETWPFDRLWEALLAQRCVFTPEFALKLALNCDSRQWSDAANFAHSLAAALPRTAQAKQAVERRIADLLGYSFRERAAKKQRLILRDAFAETQAPASLESRAADAAAAFERTFQAEREKAAQARQQKETIDLANLFASLDSLRNYEKTRLSAFTLAPLFFAAVKLGPAPADWLEKLQEVADGVESERQALIPLIANPTDSIVSLAGANISERAGLDAAAAAFGICAKLTQAERAALLAAEDLAAHAPSGASPSDKWVKATRTLALGPEGAALRRVLVGLMKRDGFLHKDWVGEMFGETLQRRALVWLLACYPPADVARPLGELAARAFAPSEQGPENEMIGNAALWALSELPGGAGLAAITQVGARVRYPKTRQRINALFETAAAKAGRPRAEIDEEIAPEHGFDAEGASRIALAAEAGAAEIRMSARGKAEIVWRNEAGKAVKAPTAAMTQADADGLEAARATVREIELDYGAQVRRLERLYRSPRALDFVRWREFYVEHPFVGLIARRVIWRAGDVVGLWRDGGFEDLNGDSQDVTGAKLTLWHPIDAGEREIAAWRDRLAALGIDQPFRQAWRESYRVTDAERATGHYSNRFAGHIVRQHQFMTLARLNDWNCRHRMWQDVANDEPTFVAFPEHGVYAEYWTAGFGGDDPPVADSTAYLYLTTDRVVFHRVNPEAAPNRPASLRGVRLDVAEVPPLVFSEMLRDCDLFVSVASIARDAQWLDRGRDARHPSSWHGQADAYWRSASEASLQANAQLRRELLERLLPALGMGDRLKLDDRRLHVEGVRGAYVIHLSSGAAFHESGQHICIVPDGAPKKLALPYEGDETLAVILSKAMLLLHDDKIADSVILRQL